MNRRWFLVGGVALSLMGILIARTRLYALSVESSRATDEEALIVPTDSSPTLPQQSQGTRRGVVKYKNADLVATAPNGVGSLQWSKDGKVVKVFATSWDEESKWYPACFDGASRHKLSTAQGDKAFAERGFHVKTIWGGSEGEGSTYKGDVLGVCDGPGECKTLEGSDYNHFGSGYVNGDPTSFFSH